MRGQLGVRLHSPETQGLGIPIHSGWYELRPPYALVEHAARASLLFVREVNSNIRYLVAVVVGGDVHLLRAKAHRPCPPPLAQKRPPEGVPSGLYYPAPVCAVARLAAYYFD